MAPSDQLKMLVVTSMALLCHLRPTMVAESPRDMTATNVMAEAENFAAQQEIPPTKLLILVTDLVFARESIKSQANLLVIEDYHSNRSMANVFQWCGEDAVPFYFDVLATGMKVIVISAPYTVFKTAPDPFQNFRHSCLLHIVLGAKKLPAVFVNTLFWFPTGARHFACVTYFDHVIYFRQERSMNSCSPREHKCSIGSLTHTTKGPWRAGFLNVLISCNTTNVTATFYLTLPLNYDQDRLTSRYAHSHMDAFECFTLLRPREPDITTLIEPLSGGFCVLLSSTILVLVKIISSLRIQGFLSCLAETVFSMISALPIQGNTRRYSHLFFLSCTLTLGFFMELIYTNFVMSSFLNRKVPEDCVQFGDCRFESVCSSQEFLLYHLTARKCSCSLSYQQRMLVGKPLHRALRKTDGNRVFSVLSNTFHLKAEKNAGPRVSLDGRGQLVLVMIRVSSTVDRSYQMGVVSMARLTRLPVYSVPDRTKRLYREKANQRLNEYLDFVSTDDLFDMERFRKMQPLFGFCLVSAFVVFCYERFFRARPKTPKTSFFVSAVDDEPVNHGRDSPDRVLRGSGPASAGMAPQEEIQRAAPSTSFEADTDVLMDV